MHKLIRLIAENEEWLAEQVIGESSRLGVGKNQNSRPDGLLLSIRNLSKAISVVIEKQESQSPPDTLNSDAIKALKQFGAIQSEALSLSGEDCASSLAMFKLYRRKYFELLEKHIEDFKARIDTTRLLGQCFDEIEVGLVGAWLENNTQSSDTEHQKANQLLLEEKTKLYSIIESYRNPVYLVTEHDQIAYLNFAARDLLHNLYPAHFNRELLKDYDGFMDRLERRNIGELLPMIAPHFSRFKETADGDDSVEITVEVGNGTRSFNTQFSRMLDVNERFPGIVILMSDITEKKRIEKERDRFFAMSADLLCLAGFDGYFKQLNPAWTNILGWSEKELMSRPYIEFVHPEDQNATVDASQDIQDGNTLMSFLNRYQCKDGSYRWLSWNSIPVMEDGLIYAVARDITDSKTAEKAIRDSEERLKEAEKLAHIGHWEYNISTRKMTWSDQVYRLYERDPSLGPHRFKDNRIYYGDYTERFESALSTVTKTGKRTTVEYQVNVPSRRTVWHYGIIEADKDETGKIVGLFGTVQDITERKLAEQQRLQSEQDQKESNEKLQNIVGELRRRNEEIELLNQMNELLQACRSPSEAFEILALTLRRVFPYHSGELHVVHAESKIAERILAWGQESSNENEFPIDDCWVMRLGKTHVVHKDALSPACSHITRPSENGYIGVPLIAHGEIFGVVHLLLPDADADQPFAFDLQAQHRFLETVTEQLSLTVATLRLQERLRNQSVRDPLTDLFNRRYMEESLERELKLAIRKKAPLALILFDIDHFKAYNDAFGHSAGDRLLQHLGSLMSNAIRGEDIACRYGGEEFVLILPNANKETAQSRAEELRLMVKERFEAGKGASSRNVTISSGVAVYPDHGESRDDILDAADGAMYQAKRGGRDMVVVADLTKSRENNRDE